MASTRRALSLVVLYALIAVTLALFEGGPRLLQERLESLQAPVPEEEASEFGELVAEGLRAHSRFLNWTSCNASVTPLFSCKDCQTVLICRPHIGGILLSCSNPFMPNCNQGFCSHIKSDGC